MGNEFAAISRRDFLKLTAKSAVFSSAFLNGCAIMAADGSKKTARAIDIHHHYFPAELIDEIKQHSKSLDRRVATQRSRLSARRKTGRSLVAAL